MASLDPNSSFLLTITSEDRDSVNTWVPPTHVGDLNVVPSIGQAQPHLLQAFAQRTVSVSVSVYRLFFQIINKKMPFKKENK